MVANIVCSAGGKLMLGFLLVCCVGFASAQNYSPFSGGTRYSNGLSISSLNNHHITEQAGNSRYSGLSGGRTTFDPRYQLSGGVPKSLVENPFFAEQDRNPYEEKLQYRSGADDPEEEDRLPLGDPIIPLLLMLAAYAVWKQRKTHASRSTSK
ncbi:MAG: hypothetical protein IJS49_01665 [Paludibacteraceae bacterium]|nr:hypothetical protein [Paludibacteraceae bacterium]